MISPSRVSRDKIEYCKIIKELNRKGITVEYATEHDNAHEYVSFLMYMLGEDNKVKKRLISYYYISIIINIFLCFNRNFKPL